MSTVARVPASPSSGTAESDPAAGCARIMALLPVHAQHVLSKDQLETLVALADTVLAPLSETETERLVAECATSSEHAQVHPFTSWLLFKCGLPASAPWLARSLTRSCLACSSRT